MPSNNSQQSSFLNLTKSTTLLTPVFLPRGPPVGGRGLGSKGVAQAAAATSGARARAKGPFYPAPLTPVSTIDWRGPAVSDQEGKERRHRAGSGHVGVEGAFLEGRVPAPARAGACQGFFFYFLLSLCLPLNLDVGPSRPILYLVDLGYKYDPRSDLETNRKGFTSYLSAHRLLLQSSSVFFGSCEVSRGSGASASTELGKLFLPSV